MPVGLCFETEIFAVLSILAWHKSARTVCKSPVPFKMWRAFVRRNDSMLKDRKINPALFARLAAGDSFALTWRCRALRGGHVARALDRLQSRLTAKTFTGDVEYLTLARMFGQLKLNTGKLP
jgi:hypothetical protein